MNGPAGHRRAELPLIESPSPSPGRRPRGPLPRRTAAAQRRRRRDPRRQRRGPHSDQQPGLAGPLLIVALALIHTVVFYPAEIVNAAAGFAYGFFPALATGDRCLDASGLICYAVGTSVARPLLDRWLGAERFERTEAMIERGGITLLIAVRLIPILPFSLVSYAAGAAHVPLWRFVWTTVVGYMPITALAVYFGTRLEGLSLTDPLVIGTAAALLVLLLIGHRVIRRQAGRIGPKV